MKPIIILELIRTLIQITGRRGLVLNAVRIEQPKIRGDSDYQLADSKHTLRTTMIMLHRRKAPGWVLNSVSSSFCLESAGHDQFTALSRN